MSDTTITNLPPAATLTGSEFLPVDQGSTTVRATTAAVAALASSLNPAGDILSEQRATGTPQKTIGEYLVFPASSVATIINYQGGQPGYVDQIEYALDSTDGASFNSATVNVYVDGSSTPSITMPAPNFFQAQYMFGNFGASPFANAAFGNRFFAANAGQFPGNSAAGNGTFVCMLPIPFNTGIKITINNGSSTTAARLFYHVKYQIGVPNTWPYTRHLRMAYVNLNNPAANSHHQLVNVIGKGRVIGVWFMEDDNPNSMNPAMAVLEGDWRMYIDAVNKAWSAGLSITSGDTIIDSNGNLQTASTTGLTGGSQPTWAQGAGLTTTDNTVTWTMTPGQPGQFWIASRPFALNMMIVDPNGNVQRVTTAGTSGASQPTWNATVGGTTTDNGITWTNQGSTYLAANWQTDGTESYFMLGYYFQSVPGFWSQNGYIGTTFFNRNNSPNFSNVTPTTVSAYRFHTVDPIRFNSQFCLMWQSGDTSQVSWTSGGPDVWIVVYYYLE